MRYSRLIFLLVIAFFTGMISCNNDDTCRKNKRIDLGVKFYLDTLNLKTNKHDIMTLTMDSITVKGVGVDSVLYNNKKKISSIRLPLNKLAEESRYSICFNNIYDTLVIRYKNTEEYLSLECGSIRTHSIEEVLSTTHFIDSIIIKNPIVNTTANVENIQIYHIK